MVFFCSLWFLVEGKATVLCERDQKRDLITHCLQHDWRCPQIADMCLVDAAGMS